MVAFQILPALNVLVGVRRALDHHFPNAIVVRTMELSISLTMALLCVILRAQMESTQMILPTSV